MSMVIGGALLVVGVVLVVMSEFVTFRVVEEINRESKPDQQISLFFLKLKMNIVTRRYKELFPEGTKLRQSYVMAILGILLGFLGFVIMVSSNFTTN